MGNWICKFLGAGALVVGGLVSGGVIPATYAALAAALTGAAGLFHDKPSGGQGAAFGLIFGLGVLGAASCAHNSFERCIRARELNAVDEKVQAAIACQGDKECLVTQGIGSISNYYENVDMCRAETLGTDGGGQ